MEEGPGLSENLQSNEVPEQSYNTEENMIYNPPIQPNPINFYQNNNVPANDNNATSAVVSSSVPASNTNVDTNSVWYDLSIISWFLVLCTGWNLFKESSNITLFQERHMPLFSNLSLTVGITSLIGTIGFILYFRNSTIQKNQNYISGMLGDMSKYHSIPLFLVSLLFICLTNNMNDGEKNSYIFALIFSLLAYISLIIVYVKMDFSAEWYEIITTKKGIFSCLIAMTLYTFFLSFASIGAVSEEPSLSFLKGTGIAFSLLVGVGNLAFSFFFKDLLVGIMNLILYIEMSKFFYSSKEHGEIKADGVIDIIMVIISASVIFYLFFKERENLYRS